VLFASRPSRRPWSWTPTGAARCTARRSRSGPPTSRASWS